MTRVYGSRLGAYINFGNTEGGTMPEKLKFTHEIPYPNGQGYTPCTAAYYAKKGEYAALRGKCEHLNQFTPDDYQRLGELDNELAQMQLNGHLGKGVRY